MNSLDAFKALSREFNDQLRTHSPSDLNYAILIPTLRCNLRCSYCQVSRADFNSKGYDWSQTKTDDVINYLLKNSTQDLKVEFQGGEPTLRVDLLGYIIEKVSAFRPDATFVICSNLQELTTELLSILENDKVYLSCSLDGPKEIHQANRTFESHLTEQFFDNLDFILSNFGTDKISLLPTISDYSKVNETIDFYFEKGLKDIFLRPVNYHGFARKKFRKESEDIKSWQVAYQSGIDYLFAKNERSKHKLAEATFSIHLSKFFNPSSKNYVDLRNPNPLGKDYLVFDYDGAIYPTDEARMMSRIGLIDFRIGDIKTGLDKKSVEEINLKNSNIGDATCNKCRYQSFCGVDNIDKISRYGSLDLPTENTFFCQNHLSIFKFVSNKIASKSEIDIKNMNFHLTGFYEPTTLFSGYYND